MKKNIIENNNNNIKNIICLFFTLFSILISIVLGVLFVPFILDRTQYIIYFSYFILCILIFILNVLLLYNTNLKKIISIIVSIIVTFIPFSITSIIMSISLSPTYNEKGNVVVRLMTNLNGKTKNEILEHRKRIVSASIFKSNNYIPKHNIWNNIQDNIPWESIYTATCQNGDWNNEYYLKGWSSESRFINNPEILVGITPVKKYNAKINQRCEGTIIWGMPYKINYSKKENLITAYYLDLQGLNNKFLKINTVNAQDFGYKYITLNLKSINTNNSNKKDITNTVLELNNSYYTDYSNEKLKIVVNRINEYPAEYEFNPQLNTNNLEEREIEFKLWKNNPNSIDDTADFTYKIVFKTSSKNKEVFLHNIVETDTVKGLYFKLLNGVEPNYFKYKMEKY